MQAEIRTQRIILEDSQNPNCQIHIFLENGVMKTQLVKTVVEVTEVELNNINTNEN